jgi:hypothetical protein
MIKDLDKTIAALLRRDLPPALVGQVQISFATPDDQFPPQSVTLPAIDLFLYDVRENLELRSNEVYFEYDLPLHIGLRTGGPPVTVGPVTSKPISVDDIETR